MKKTLAEMSLTFFILLLVTGVALGIQSAWSAWVVTIWGCLYVVEAHLESKHASAVKFNVVAQILDRLDKADATIEAINGDLSSVIKSHAEIQKMAEETKKLLTESKLTNAFAPKRRP